MFFPLTHAYFDKRNNFALSHPSLGFLVGVLVLRNIRELPWERTLWVVGVIIYVVLVLFAILFNGFYQGYPNSDWIYGSLQKP